MVTKQAITVVCLTMVAAAAAAQTEETLEEIVVSGQKIQRSLQDTKESVAVVDRTAIQSQRLIDLRDVFDQTANAIELGNGEDFGIRGVSASSASTGGGAGELGSLFLDGVALTGFARRFGPKALWDIEQVEILRGPQSTNVGRNALIGAVIMTSARPDPSAFDAALRLDGGNYGRLGFEGMVNVPVSLNSALRFTAETLDLDGYHDNRTLGIEDFDARSNQTYRARFLATPSERLSIGLMAQYAETERGQDIFRADLLDNIEDRTSSANLVAFENYEAVSAAVDIGYELSDSLSLRSVTSVLDGSYERFDDDDEGPEGGNAFRGRDAEDSNWTQELRLNVDGERLKGVAGLWATGIDVDNDTLGLVNINPAELGVPASLLPFYPPGLEVDVLIPATVETFNAAFFTEWDYRFDNGWHASFGFRYDYEDQEQITNNINSLAPGSELPDPVAAGQLADMLSPGSGPFVEAGVTQVNGLLQSFLLPTDNPREKTDYEAFLPQIGTTYEVSEAVSLSAFYKRGYRAGGSEVALTGMQSDFDPEYLDNYELSLRSQWLEGRLTINANAYFGDWTDQQVQSCPMGNLSCVTVNAGESEIYGLELDTRLTLGPSGSVFASVGYSQTEFREFVDNDEVLSGNQFAFSPEVTAAIGGEWLLTDSLSVSGSVTYQGESFADVQNTIVLDSRTLLNLNLRYAVDRFSAVLYGRNMTDEFYLTSDFLGIDGMSRVVRAGPPREYGILLTLSY